ncbi:MAG TPA: response regulator [Candidatus Limnocylindria bacterium]|jgi:DNA-binding response OmpR family regulator|nr:response regulator [Candidatus Limnocylindria bacterium]
MESTEKQNILVVEDNENTRRLLETILRNSGYEVTLAPDAEEGLRILQEAAIDLILLDLILPGADGVQFLRLRAEMEPDRQPPVIVVSATEDMDTLRPQLRELGAKLALRKPFDVQELLDGVRQYAIKRTAKEAAPAAAHAAKAPRAKSKGKSATKS